MERFGNQYITAGIKRQPRIFRKYFPPGAQQAGNPRREKRKPGCVCKEFAGKSFNPSFSTNIF
jgi:hypothetical protein